MKIYSSKAVKAAESVDDDDETYTLLDWAENLSYIAYRQGYNLEHNAQIIDMNNPEELDITLTPENEMMPEVEVYVKKETSGKQPYLYLEVNIMNFPDLYNDKMEFHDSWTYHIKQWADAGKLADDLSQETFILE